MAALVPGDVVRLKSQDSEKSPGSFTSTVWMTVEEVDAGRVTCVWFPTPESHPARAAFRPDALEKRTQKA